LGQLSIKCIGNHKSACINIWSAFLPTKGQALPHIVSLTQESKQNAFTPMLRSTVNECKAPGSSEK